MQPDADGLRILRVVANRPEAFPRVAAELARCARSLVIRELKARDLRLHDLRRLHDSLGAQTFALAATGLTEAEARTLVKRLDGYHPDPAEVEAEWSRCRLHALAAGAAPAVADEDAAKPPVSKPARKAPPPAPVIRRALGSAAFAAVWDGRDHDSGSGKPSSAGKPKKAR